MNKEQYAEFHKYLAMLIYEYTKMLYNPCLSEKFKTEVEEILKALDKIMRLCFIEGEV